MESIEEIKQSFDKILSKFDENNNFLTDITSIKEIIQIILHTNEKYFFEPDFLNHRLFIFLRDWYLNILQQWCHGGQLNEISDFVFDMIPNLFLKMSNHISDKNIQILKDLILYKPILNELNIFLQGIILNGKYLQEPQIKSLDNLFRTIQRLQRNYFDIKSDPLLIKFFENIVKCICSSSFINICFHSTTKENDNIGEKFLLHTCIDYIYSHPTDQLHKQSLVDIRNSLLHPFSQWLTKQSCSFRLWNNRMSIILRQICFILTLCIQHNRYINLDRDIFNCYCQLIDSFINILYSIFQIENFINNKFLQNFLGIIISNLNTIILSNQLEKYFKTKHITTIIFKLINYENDEIQLNAFGILSSILTEQDTKNITNSINIANIFIKFLTKIIDDSNQTLRFYNLLHCLKHLIHFDQIKDEFIKQNGLPLILRSATETKFKPLQAQQPALEILLALTFNKEAYRKIKENLNDIKFLLPSSHTGVSRAIDCLLWRLEIQEDMISKSKILDKTYKYDLMISYSQADKELTHQIYDQLIKDNFRVWIDIDETFGKTMIDKTNIIDQSKYILICMSDEYKQNSYCRCEASYAYQCQYNIIPLLLTINSHLNGWLNDLIKGNIYIDFIKLDFNLAYKKLKSEINREDIYPKIESIIEQITVLPKIEQISSLQNFEQILSRSKVEQIYSSPIKIEYPSNIKQWTTDDVKSFLIANNFKCLFPIISEMNGFLLYDLYTMCIDNRESMFHTLKNELLTLDKNIQPLTLFIYLQFLYEIRKYVSIINHH